VILDRSFATAGDKGSRAPFSASARDGEAAGRYALRVLVVDDERDAVLTLMALLRDEGYEVRGSYRGKDVMDIVREYAPHAVLLDIGMPDLNGYEVARKIRSRYGDEHGPLLVAVTGWNKSADRMLAQMAGFDHHVAKPYDPQALLALLKPLRTIGG
jgi:DNA-binding response OmpR family regulator